MTSLVLTVLILNCNETSYVVLNSLKEILNFVIASEQQLDDTNTLLLLDCAAASSYLGNEEIADAVEPLLRSQRERKMLQMCRFRALAERREYQALKTQLCMLDQLGELDVLLAIRPLIRRREFNELLSMAECIDAPDVRFRVYLESFRETASHRIPTDFSMKVKRELASKEEVSLDALSLYGFIQEWDTWDREFHNLEKEQMDEREFAILAIDTLLAGNLDRSMACLDEIATSSYEHWSTIQSLGAILIDQDKVDSARRVLNIELHAGKYTLFTGDLVSHYFSKGFLDQGMSVLVLVSDELLRVHIALEAIDNRECSPELAREILSYTQMLLEKYDTHSAACRVGEAFVKMSSVQYELRMIDEAIASLNQASEIYASRIFEDGIDVRISRNLLTPEVTDLGFSVISQFTRLGKHSIASGLTSQLLEQMENSKLTPYQQGFIVEDAISSYLAAGQSSKACKLAEGRSSLNHTIVKWYGAEGRLADGMKMIDLHSSKENANQLRVDLVLAYMRRSGKDYPLPSEWYPYPYL